MDISELLSHAHHMNPGSATRYLEGFATAMAAVGHTALTISGYLDSAIHFGGWLEASGLDFANMNEQTILAFGEHRWECAGGRQETGVSQAYTKRVHRFADYLLQQGVIATLPRSTAVTPSPLNDFRDWLLRHRGLAPVTVERHERLVTRMLPALGADVGAYNAALVRTVILEQICGCRPAQAKTIVGALRVYLRFLAMNGSCQPGLDHMLPTVAEWKLSSLPRYLDANQAARLIDSCSKTDRKVCGTERSYYCCSGLGSVPATLRACAQRISIGRMARCWCEGRDADVRLPLPQDAGDAVLDYIDHARPPVAIDRVFPLFKCTIPSTPSGNDCFRYRSCCTTACWDREPAIAWRESAPAHCRNDDAAGRGHAGHDRNGSEA